MATAEHVPQPLARCKVRTEKGNCYADGTGPSRGLAHLEIPDPVGAVVAVCITRSICGYRSGGNKPPPPGLWRSRRSIAKADRIPSRLYPEGIFV